MFEESLNSAQAEAVEHTGSPLLIVAGAGTGKTLTLACRVARLIERGGQPERILLLTFSRRAAREMLARAERLVGDASTGRVWGGTFHAVANRLLRVHGRPLGVPPDFTVLDQADGADLMNLLRNDLGYGAGERRFPRKETLTAIYSRTINSRRPLGEVLRRHFPWCLEEREGIRGIFEAYTARKREQHVLDYDDLLLYWEAALADEATAPAMIERFDHVLVDEYQDTNAVQAEILERLRPPGTGLGAGLTVVGDDAQAIYGFRAATVRNILEFPERFPGTRIVRLEQSFRSTPPILAAANAVIARSPQRHEKTLWSSREGERRPLLRTCLDEADQADAVCRAVLAAREEGTPLRRQAVLFRAAHHSDVLEVECSRRNIPFVKFGGLKFLEAAHVKDVLALLRVLENPRDEVSWFRVLQLLEGVGPSTAGRVVAGLGLADADGRSPLRRLLEDPPPVPIGAQRGFDALRAALSACARDGDDEDPSLTPAAQIERLRAFCEPAFRRRYDAAEARLRDLDVLAQLAAGAASRGRFLADLALDPPSSTGDLAGPPLLDEDYLVLSTIHSAKGLEWDVVHVIHAADGMIPSDLATGDEDELEEERRLLYVALTRARDRLEVSFPLRYYRRRDRSDPHTYAQLSRFLQPAEIFDRFELEGPREATADDGEAGAGTARSDADERVGTFLADLWSG